MTIKTGEQIVAADVYPLLAGLIPGGRLTLESGVPFGLTDQADKTTLYYTPYNGNSISLYDGSSAWSIFTFAELTLDISGYDAGGIYDVFCYNNSGTITLEGLKWANDTTRATALARQDGVYVKTGATTRRYLGTIRIMADAKCDDSAAARMVWNMYNRAQKKLYYRSNSAVDAFFVIGEPNGQYMTFGAGGTFTGDAAAMMYLRSTVEPSGSAPYHGEAGTQHADGNDHGVSLTDVGKFAAGFCYIGWDKGGTGTIGEGHLWGELWC